MQKLHEKLKDLQEILAQKFTILHEKEELPKQVKIRKELLSRLKENFIAKDRQYKDLTEKQQHLTLEKEDAQTTREESEKKIEIIKTQREYEMLEKEIKENSQKEERLRKELQQCRTQLEDFQEELNRNELLIASEEKEIKAELKKVEQKLNEKEGSLSDLAKQEKKLIGPGINEDLLLKFERIVRNKSGLAIVPVLNGSCSGCHMVLPAEFCSEIPSSGENTIHFCPYCSRILYFDSALQKKQDEETSDEVYDTAEVGGLHDLVDEDYQLDDLE